MIDFAAHYSFGAEGSARPFMRAGWSYADQDVSWTEGTSSRVVLPLAPGEGDVLLEIGLNPLLWQPVLRRQRLIGRAGRTVREHRP